MKKFLLFYYFILQMLLGESKCILVPCQGSGSVQFIRFRQFDPHYGNRAEEVIVAVAQVVKIEPVYYEGP